MIDVKQRLDDLGFITRKAKLRNGVFRCPTISKPNKDNGWYRIFDTVCCYGDWSGTIENGYFFTEELKPLTQEEKKAYAQKKAQAEELARQEKTRDLQERQNRVNEYTREVLPKIVTDGDSHPYLIRKKCKNKRWDMSINNKNELVIPVYNFNGEVVGYQFIYSEKKDGKDKKFLTGSNMDGTWYPLREPGVAIYEAEWIVLVEGFATADAMEQILENYTDSKFFVVICGFNAGNLPKVAKHFDKLAPQAEKILVADNDPAGIKAAKDSGWNWFTMSAFDGGDANDTICDFGLDAATDLFHAQLKQLNKKHSNSDF